VPTACWVAAPRCGQILDFESTDGGRTWGPAHVIARAHVAAGPLDRFPSGPPLISAAVDGTGRLYLAWADCRFRARCTANDIVMTTSTNGRTWSPAIRVTRGPGDHIVPGIGASSQPGSRARIGVTYYIIPHPHCTPATCVIAAGFTTSADGGSTWSRQVPLARPFRASWLAKIPGGVTLSDWIGATVLPGGNVIAAFALASKPTGATFRQNMYAVAGGMPVRGG